MLTGRPSGLTWKMPITASSKMAPVFFFGFAEGMLGELAGGDVVLDGDEVFNFAGLRPAPE